MTTPPGSLVRRQTQRRRRERLSSLGWTERMVLVHRDDWPGVERIVRNLAKMRGGAPRRRGVDDDEE